MPGGSSFAAVGGAAPDDGSDDNSRAGSDASEGTGDGDEGRATGGGRTGGAYYAPATSAALLAALAGTAAFAGRSTFQRRAAGSGPSMRRALGTNHEKYTGHDDGDSDSSSSSAAEDRPDQILDFAIVGFPKTGTSFMEHYLFGTADEIHIDNREHCLTKPDARDVLDDLVNERGYQIGDVMMADGKTRIKNAIKCPHGIYGEYNLGNYERYLPDIKFIVSTRHPVLWFQSWYNYVMKQHYEHSGGDVWNPPTVDLIGPCAIDSPYHYGAPNKHKIKAKRNVCTDGAKFHHALSRFGKTPMNSREELALLQDHDMAIHPFPRAKVFLMELGQFDAEDATLAGTFERDLGEYLGLAYDLPPLVPHEHKEVREEIRPYVIDICDGGHDLVRAELVGIGRDASAWIRDYFVKSPDVHVSSEGHFLDLIERWRYDPCEVDEDA